MRIRLSDAATSAVLAEHFRTQAAACHQMALMSVSPFKEVWLELAAEWAKLAEEQEGTGKAALIAACGRARKATGSNAPVEKRTGKDSKARRSLDRFKDFWRWSGA
jgi:hypothetical protein